jgi:[ribosomal protein S5]-alanine N-acetyltransferase
MLPTLATERLVLRPLVLDDAEAAHAFLSDADVMRYWSSGPHSDVAQTRSYMVGNCIGGDYESWAITVSGEVAGWINIRVRRPAVAEMGYILARPYWGQGIAREAIIEVVRHAFESCGVRRIFADTDPENAASIMLLERLGFRKEGLLRGEWETHLGVRDSLIFGLLKDDWLARQSGG